MTKREEILKYGLSFLDVYSDTPFRDDNWVLLRYRKNKKAFAWTYERNGHVWVNVKVDPEWRDFWRNTYSSVLPGYHQNKEHWNSIILDATIPDKDIKRMIAKATHNEFMNQLEQVGKEIRKLYSWNNEESKLLNNSAVGLD